MRFTLSIATVLLLVVDTSFADGNEWSEKNNQETQAAAPQEKLDPRLPPLLPGEPVVRGGKKMHMWSTSGPVPVSEPPEPFQGQQKIDVDDVDVIIDRRSDSKPDANGR